MTYLKPDNSSKRLTEIKHLHEAVDCFAEQLTDEQIERLHKALMFKGPALEQIMEIVKGGANG